MKLFIYVLYNTDLLDQLLKELHKHEIKGATILSSTGMARKLLNEDDQPFIGSLKALLMGTKVESNTILIALPEAQVETVFKIVETVVGDLSLPTNGIAFTVPIDQIKGYKG